MGNFFLIGNIKKIENLFKKGEASNHVLTVKNWNKRTIVFWQNNHKHNKQKRFKNFYAFEKIISTGWLVDESILLETRMKK